MKFLLSLFLLFAFFRFAYADTIYLKNGRSISGIIKRDDGETVELEVDAGSVKFLKSEIKSIAQSPKQDAQALRQQWEISNQDLEERIVVQKLEEERKPRVADFSRGAQGITLDVLLNDKVKARMILDTGASAMVITRDIAQQLRINLVNIKPDIKAQVADGRQIDAKRVIIDKVEVQGVEASNVEAVVLLNETNDLGFGDGLLGMSFLKKFNFKVDQKGKKLILEKF